MILTRGPCPCARESSAAVKLFGSAPLLATVDDKVLEQIVNVATLPGLVGSAMTMPDAHWGYGFPIGGVVFDAEQGGIVSADGVGYERTFATKRKKTSAWNR